MPTIEINVGIVACRDSDVHPLQKPLPDNLFVAVGLVSSADTFGHCVTDISPLTQSLNHNSQSAKVIIQLRLAGKEQRQTISGHQAVPQQKTKQGEMQGHVTPPPLKK